MARPILLSAKSVLKAPREALWTYLCDTDRMNRAIGLPPVQFTPYAESYNARHYQAQASLFGIRLGYEEFPFEWVEGSYYHVLRRFPSGPLLEYTGGIRLSEAEGGGTELESFAYIVPRNFLGAVIARTVGARIVKQAIPAFADGFARRLDSIRRGGAWPLAAGLDQREFEARMGRLRGLPVAEYLVGPLKSHLLTASDIEVACMRPYELAERWSAERLELLRLLLYAVKCEILTLRWIVHCPHCRAPRLEAASLSELKAESQCEACGLVFDNDLAATIEARFRAHPAIRPGIETSYCVGGPANTPHVLAQFRLDPGETRREILTLAPGRLRLACFQAPQPASITVSREEGVSSMVKANCEKGTLRVTGACLKPGRMELVMVNSPAREALFALERDDWQRSALSAAALVGMREFQELLPEERVSFGKA